MMKHFHFLIIPLILALSPYSYCMETSIPVSQPNILMELTIVKKPMVISCFPGNLVAIVGLDGCSLCDYSTNTEIAKINTLTVPYGRVPYIATHPDKKVFIFGSFHKEMTVYDSQTKQTWQQELDVCNAPIFNPTDDTLLTQQNFCLETNLFNYKNKLATPYRLEPSFSVMLDGFHPTKPNECLAHTISTVSVLTWNKNIFIAQKTIAQLRLHNMYDIERCRYSPDGSLIAILRGSRRCDILEPKSNSLKLLEHSTKYNVWSIGFHPTSFIIAALATKPYTVCYWNTKTLQLITTTPLPFSSDGEYGGKRIEFSCDGIKLIVVAEKCVVLEVPWEVLYKNLTKDSAIFTYWLLKEYQQTQKYAVPNEIIDLLIKNLLEVSKYSFTNY